MWKNEIPNLHFHRLRVCPWCWCHCVSRGQKKFWFPWNFPRRGIIFPLAASKIMCKKCPLQRSGLENCRNNPRNCDRYHFLLIAKLLPDDEEDRQYSFHFVMCTQQFTPEEHLYVQRSHGRSPYPSLKGNYNDWHIVVVPPSVSLRDVEELMEVHTCSTARANCITLKPDTNYPPNRCCSHRFKIVLFSYQPSLPPGTGLPRWGAVQGRPPGTSWGTTRPPRRPPGWWSIGLARPMRESRTYRQGWGDGGTGTASRKCTVMNQCSRPGTSLGAHCSISAA